MVVAPSSLRLLTFFAHPDDESFGPAAVLAQATRAGAWLGGVWATRGEHGQPLPEGTPPPGPRAMALLREADLRAAAGVLGYSAVAFLGYEDGTLATVPDEVLRGHALAALRQYQPHVVLTFGPAGITRHPDHMAVHRAMTSAFHLARAEGLPAQALYYDAVPTALAVEMGVTGNPDGQPNTHIEVPPEAQAAKLAALRLHARHVADARDMAERLAVADGAAVATLYRAWPPVPVGHELHDLLIGDEPA